jgi:hypothetical protein
MAPLRVDALTTKARRVTTDLASSATTAHVRQGDRAKIADQALTDRAAVTARIVETKGMVHEGRKDRLVSSATMAPGPTARQVAETVTVRTVATRAKALEDRKGRLASSATMAPGPTARQEATASVPIAGTGEKGRLDPTVPGCTAKVVRDRPAIEPLVLNKAGRAAVEDQAHRQARNLVLVERSAWSLEPGSTLRNLPDPVETIGPSLGRSGRPASVRPLGRPVVPGRCPNLERAADARRIDGLCEGGLGPPYPLEEKGNWLTALRYASYLEKWSRAGCLVCQDDISATVLRTGVFR